MPALSNAKHEQVAQMAAQGMNATQAYLTVYPTSTPEAAAVSASRLLNSPKVRDRVSELQNATAAKAVVTAQMILERAWEVANSDAKDRGQHLAIAARAFPEFKDGIQAPNQTLVLNGLNDEQLDAVIKRLSGG